jgi:hypothetical protein
MFEMTVRPFLPLTMAVFFGFASSARADVGPLQALYCIPQLPASRVLTEFSELLDEPECAWTRAKRNIATHLIGVSECRTVDAPPGAEICKTFSFQINNTTPLSPQASGALFWLKGTGRWCRGSIGGWYPFEPDQIDVHEVNDEGPRLPRITCREPEGGWVHRFAEVLVASVPLVPAVAPGVVASPPPPPPPPPEIAAAAPQAVAVAPAARSLAIVPPPPPSARPLCQAGYARVCTDLVALHYLDAGDASDLVFGRVVREFLLDERVAVPTGVPPLYELERLTAAALARSRATSTCPTDPRVAGPIVACGRS